jgi:hypothetical protein
MIYILYCYFSKLTLVAFLKRWRLRPPPRWLRRLPHSNRNTIPENPCLTRFTSIPMQTYPIPDYQYYDEVRL